MRTLLLVCLLVTGCATPPPAKVEYAPLRKDVERLLAHPELRAAIQAAPNFTADALNTVRRLNHEINSDVR